MFLGSRSCSRIDIASCGHRLATLPGTNKQRQSLLMPPACTGVWRLLKVLQALFYLVVSPVLRHLSGHQTLSVVIGKTLILLAAVAVLEEVVFGILGFFTAFLRWAFWSIRWILVCIMIFVGKRLLFVILIPQAD
jgi:hypothetical protein